MSRRALTRQEKIELAQALAERERRINRKKQSNPNGGLMEFIRYFWRVLEPVDDFVEGWPLECLCAHLEAITRGETVDLNGEDRPFNRFWANVPPGFMKSLTVNVFWPAWEWGPMGLAHLRYVAFSYSPDLTERDNAKFRDLITSPQYRELWGHVFNVVGDGKVRVTNDKTGFKYATSLNGVGTGERGHRVILDDLHKIKGTAESDEARASITNWVREGAQNRLNDIKRDVIVGIMQRVHEADASGIVQKHLADDYCCLIIPMEYESNRHFSHYTGWNNGEDPRSRDGQLAWPARFGRRELASFKANSYLWAGQYQQNPVPRGGGLIKESWWHVHEVKKLERGAYKFVPEFVPLYVLASLDTAYSEREENDYSALTVWAVHEDARTKHRKILLVDAWQKRLPELSGEQVEREDGESEAAYQRRAREKWGLVEWVNFSCKRRKVNRLIIENKNRAPDVVRTLKKLFANTDYGIQSIDVRGDKWSRTNAIVDMFTDNMIHAPAEITESGDVRFLDWAQETIDNVTAFPRGVHDDLLDSTAMALKHLRDIGLAIRRDESAAEEHARSMHRSQRAPLYAV